MSLAATATMVLMLLLLAGFWIIQTGLLAGLQFTEQKVEVVGYLQTICIAPEARGAGIGTELMRFAEERVFMLPSCDRLRMHASGSLFPMRDMN
jgi:ribosomal protein S18 acetylase RimI-like enzyme